jgi:hemoglobin
MSIYERIGGAEAVAAAVDVLYGRVLADPLLAPHFAGVDMARLKLHQRAFLAAILRGPAMYAGRSMAAGHARVGAPPEAFASFMGHLLSTLEDMGLDDGIVASIGAKLSLLEMDIVSRSPVA